MLCHSLSLESCDPSLSLTFTAICSHFNSTLEIKEIYCFTVNRTLNSDQTTNQYWNTKIHLYHRKQKVGLDGFVVVIKTIIAL